jgi:hypothetical protein
MESIVPCLTRIPLETVVWRLALIIVVLESNFVCVVVVRTYSWGALLMGGSQLHPDLRHIWGFLEASQPPPYQLLSPL